MPPYLPNSSLGASYVMKLYKDIKCNKYFSKTLGLILLTRAFTLKENIWKNDVIVRYDLTVVPREHTYTI